MKVALVVAVAGSIAGCRNLLGIDQADLVDGASVDVTPTPDAPTGPICLGAFQEICFDNPPTGERSLSGLDLTCSDQRTYAGADVCIQAAGRITLAPDARYEGGRPDRFLVLFATESIDIAGTLDGWTSPSTACTTGIAGTSAGGAGGSFGTQGGSGGGSPLTPPGPVAGPITTFRSGCPGGAGGASSPPGGTGGAAGAGIFLVAPSIHLAASARINASGGGGQGGDDMRGGGGGGSGGLIVFDATSLTIDQGAIVIALGGGGGQGGGTSAGIVGTSGTRALATTPLVPGDGGEDAPAGGKGGDATLDGAGLGGGPVGSARGSGGGGGGLGVILTTATTRSVQGSVVPSLAN